MIGLTLVYIVIVAVEWDYLKRYTRKPRTKWVVLSFVVASYLYNIVVLLTNENGPTPDMLMTKLMGPIQKAILRQ